LNLSEVTVPSGVSNLIAQTIETWGFSSPKTPIHVTVPNPTVD